MSRLQIYAYIFVLSFSTVHRLQLMNPAWEGGGYACSCCNLIRGVNSMLQHFHVSDRKCFSTAAAAICLEYIGQEVGNWHKKCMERFVHT